MPATETSTSTSTSTFATPAKLRDGSWGVRVQGAAHPGQVVTVRTQAGKTWETEIERVVWQGEGVTLASTRQVSARPASLARAVSRCKSCRGPITHVPYQRAMHGYCGACAFDEL